MAFFNKLGEKITSGASAVSDSAKRMSEVSKLNSKINLNLSEITNKYTEIGRAVKLRLMESIEDDEVKRLAGEIDALLAEISQLKDMVNAAKGLKNCPNCGSTLNSDVLFCPSCGAKQEVAQSASEAVPVSMPEPSVNVQPAAIPMPAESAAAEQPMPMPVIEENTAAEIPQPAAEPIAVSMPEPSVNVQPEVIPMPVENAAATHPVPMPVAETTAPVEIPQPAVQSVSAPMPEPVISAVQSAPAFVFCTECGNKEQAGTKFCSECGTKFD